TLKNAIVVSPMCQYSAVDGFPTPYHLAHLGSFAIHGAGTIMMEASGVTPQGRITPEDLGIYKDEHIPAHASLVSALRSFTKDLTVGVQIAHAGRKASTWSPFYEGPKKNPNYVTAEEGGWPEEVVGPSALAYDEGHIVAKELTTEEVQEIETKFVEAADRAYKAGYDFVELHGAHGYLLHSFLSPLSNKRKDQYGGSVENRARLITNIVEKINKQHPDLSVWVRVSGSDFADHLKEKGEDPWTIEGTKEFAKLLSKLNVDVLDISGGGLVGAQQVKAAPGYQLPFAKAVSQLKLSHPLVGTVGRMESGEHAGYLAEQALHESDASLVLIARGFLTKPNWVEESAEKLVGEVTATNPQYHRALPVKE
ncbi:FMN-linked oxidoreductase, partial [Meira miltonrushii]